MAFNILRTIYRAYIHEQYSLVAFIFFIYFSFFLLEYCSYIYINCFPPNEKSLHKDIVGVVIWFLYLAITFGFIGQFSPILGFPTALFLYVVAAASIAFFFYTYVVYDEEDDDSKCLCRSRNEVKMNFSQEQWDVIWEKV